MKKFTFSIMLIMLSALLAQGQDLITKVNGEDIYAKIIEVGQSEIKYKRFDNLEGPIFTVAKREVLMVRYENGTKDIFSTERSASSANSTYSARPAVTAREVNSQIVSGMNYKEYENLYDSHYYNPQPGDPYNPSLCGVCSFLIPGLGQIVAGEAGRGISYFCYSVIPNILVSYIGLSIPDPTAVTICFLFGTVWSLTWDIMSICDAVKVAKIKNMYNQDLRALASKVDFDMTPYFASVNMGVSSQPVAGLTLRVSF